MSDRILPADAIGTMTDSFENYLRGIDKIINENMKGYEVAAREVIGAISIDALEPCMTYHGIVNHVRRLAQRGFEEQLRITPFDTPVIISSTFYARLYARLSQGAQNFSLGNRKNFAPYANRT